MVCTALVVMMTPAVGLFYGGLVRKKNALSTLAYSFASLAVVSVLWVLIGYTLSFGPSVRGLIGSLEHAGLRGVSATSDDGLPPLLFMAFQMTFAAITPALITGAFVERKRFAAFIVFLPLWSLLVYCPIAHWVWGPSGWLAGEGAMDFAGGTVVHISSGVAALVCARMVGRRRGYGEADMSPHNAIVTMLGAALLWFGWFGFNAGSALAADGIAVNALVTTHVAASAGCVAWMAMGWMSHKKPTALGAAVGAVAGLVGVTPAAGFVGPLSALAIGAITAACCFFVIEKFLKGRIDDSLDVFGVHGVGGIVGALLTGVFASTAVNPGGTDGLVHGNWGQVLVQAKAVVVVALFSAVMTAVILKAVGLFLPLRVTEAEEEAGLDLSQHGEHAYPPVGSPT